MAISNNPLLIGASGRIGDLVIRQCKGKTIIAMAPPRRRKTPPTAAQIEQQKRFAEMMKIKRKN